MTRLSSVNILIALQLALAFILKPKSAAFCELYDASYYIIPTFMLNEHA